MPTNVIAPAPATWERHPGYRISFRAPRRLNARLLWAICAGLSGVAAATFSALELVAGGWEQLFDPATGPARVQMSVVTFGLCFVGAFLSSSTLAFSSVGLLGLKVERRRRPERRPLNVQVAVISERASYTSSSRNVSTGGMFLATTEAHEVGERITLGFQLPGNDTHHSVIGEVRWRRADGSPGVGLLFIDPPRALTSAIRRVLASRSLFDRG
jgi:Tfp pilus assembly protein PilZ